MCLCVFFSVYLWKWTVFVLCNVLFECFNNVTEFLNLKDFRDLCLTAAGCCAEVQKHQEMDVELSVFVDGMWHKL